MFGPPVSKHVFSGVPIRRACSFGLLKKELFQGPGVHPIEGSTSVWAKTVMSELKPI